MRLVKQLIKSAALRLGLSTGSSRRSQAVSTVTRAPWLRRLVLALLALLVVTAGQGLRPNGAAYGTSPPAEELRGAWLTNIDSGVLLSAAQTAQGVERLADLGLNTLYPTVWNWGYSLYPSAVAERATGTPIDPHPGLADRDLLAELVELGDRHHMAVIPWFEFGLMAPSYSAIARRHPEWLTQRQDGSQVFMQGRHPRVWLNPLHPEVQEFFVDLITEVLATYPVDGIQFDDHFGLPVEFGYDPYTVAAYGRTHGGAAPPNDPRDPDWMRWRAEQITALMEKLVDAVRRSRPDAVFSLSPNALPFAYDEYLQAWDQWQQRGWIDQLIVQIYRPSLSAFEAELDRVMATDVEAHSTVSVGILAGLKNREPATGLIAEQVAAVRERGLDGVSFFFFEAMRNATIGPLFAP